jgi:DNA-binding HxlR family transcriptional regulator
MAQTQLPDLGLLPGDDNVFSENCPSRTLLSHVTNKWGTLILIALSAGTLRWSELSRLVGGISEKMLAQTLRTLEADGLVRRDARPVVPPYVEYSLTDSGVELSSHLIPLVQWVAAHTAKDAAKLAAQKSVIPDAQPA